MRFRFDPNQAYQLRAVASVVDLFQGMGREAYTTAVRFMDFTEDRKTTRFAIDPERFLANVRAVQRANKLAEDEALRLIEATPEIGGEKRPVAFPNVSVEMETGTGKTYVYLRTALELNRRYGLKKFVIVVPSVAVREGVLKTFQVTRGHFGELFDNEAYRADVYDSKNMNRLKNFAEDDGVRFLVMTIDSFNKEDNVIRKSRDQLQGRVGLHLLQAVRPVLILDEPQNMESDARKQALAALNPLVALRYSATHRDKYNLVYRLTPFDAYRQKLVKRIEVASVVAADSFNEAFVRLVAVSAPAKTTRGARAYTAKVEVHQRMAGGAVKAKTHTVKPGDRLEDKANRKEYAGLVVGEINPGERSVGFTNGQTLREGERFGADQATLFREQIRYTVDQHFRRQEQLRGQGIKVLSLFFIDRVESYTAADGLVRVAFDEAFDALKGKYPAWANRSADEVRGAYFAGKRRKGGAVEFQDSTSGDNAEDRAAYSLIMREKERLLSFAEPVAFLFSHSALKEGWDNPNVFQICTLNQTTSEVKKRQEVGRGMRLAVDQGGERLTDEKVNVLTVVANESYEDYVGTLQAEVEDEFGSDEAKRLAGTVRNKRLEQVGRRSRRSNCPTSSASCGSGSSTRRGTPLKSIRRRWWRVSSAT